MGLRLPVAAAKGRAKLVPDNNMYEINGRAYRVEDTGTVFPESGPGLVDMDRIENAAGDFVAPPVADMNWAWR